MVSIGRSGYLEYARRIFETAFAMQDAVRVHPELRIIGEPTFCFSFTSDEFDIYHVNDFMRTRGWRFNGQQYPNAIHMAVTRPQTQPGVVEGFAKDLAEGVAYAHAHKDEKPASGAVYGGVEGGVTTEADEFIRSVMEDMLDKHQGLPRSDV
jgi:glutamate/tyrosine decarboxylase-like PLP-dependent enzyme